MTRPGPPLLRRSLWAALVAAMVSLVWALTPIDGAIVESDRQFAAVALTIIACLAAAAIAVLRR